MTVRVGDPVPDVAVQTLDNNGLKAISVSALARNGRLALFAVPGAFTPACSARHLPGFAERVGDFQAKGVQTVACIAMNDAWVMAAWGHRNHVDNRILMLADGNGAFTRAMGLAHDDTAFGMGWRSQRYAMLAQAGRITHLFVEEPGAFEVSAAPHVLAQI